MADLPRNLTEARKRAGLTQQDLADRIGVARSTINMYELGNREPKVEMIEKLAEALGTTPAEITGWSAILRDFPEAYSGDEEATRRVWDESEGSALMEGHDLTAKDILSGLAKSVGGSFKVRSGRTLITLPGKTYTFSEEESGSYVKKCAEYLLSMMRQKSG